MTIRGYTDRPSVAPGESIDFHIDVDEAGQFDSRLLRIVNGDENPRGPGQIFEEIELSATGEHFACPQKTRRGGHIYIATPAMELSQGFSVHLFVSSMLPGSGRQGLIGQQLNNAGVGWLLEIDNGALVFSVGDGNQSASVVSDKSLLPDVWYSVCATYDPKVDRLSIRQVPRLNRVNSRFGLVVPLDTDCETTAACGITPSSADAPVIIAGRFQGSTKDENLVVDCFNGKVDAPKLFPSAIDAHQQTQLEQGAVLEGISPFAHWDFGANGSVRGFSSDLVLDVSGNGRHGECVNTPDRGMTGWNWSGHSEHYAHCPEEYGAIWFHEDSVEDCGWEKTLTLDLPDGFKSGVYALEVTKDGQSDQIIFFVRPRRGTSTAKIAVLMSTFSYTVYANVISHAEGPAETVLAQATQLMQADIEIIERGRDCGLSGYEYHSDGRGNQFTTWRRPILNFRPGYLYPIGTTWNFSSDLHIISWLEAKGFAYDIITDHDLHAEGCALLELYNVVISGTHPEYVSGPILDAWEDYLTRGGRGMYLGGNGWYWVTAQHPTKPYLLEVRRGESGDQTWKARPGEYYHSFTGERGGLWRNRSRPPQKIFSTGYTAHGFATSAPYYLLPDASDSRAEWIFEGVTDRIRIGIEGLIGNGAVGQEFDRYDLNFGTPPQSLLLGSSYGHTKYDGLVPEDQFSASPHTNGEEHPLVRGDLVYFTTATGGGMFAASSMTWATSLAINGYDNDVSRVMFNVVQAFAADSPLPYVEWDQVTDLDPSQSSGKPIGPWG
jgi:N,N-dimethylformamidase